MMTRFVVHHELFDLFPDACFGVVVAEIGGNGSRRPSLQDGLNAETARVRSMLKSLEDVRAHPNVVAWREAFTRLGWNPNRFPSSIEALLSRVAKGGVLPVINPVVDAANVVSLQNLAPIGAHDMDTFTGDIEVRMSSEGDLFIPFGHPEPEPAPVGELVYVSGNQVRTRKWVWRQSEVGKILPSTTRVFFPIDGFAGKTDECVRRARGDLAAMCRGVLGATAVRELWVDSGSPSVGLD